MRLQLEEVQQQLADKVQVGGTAQIRAVHLEGYAALLVDSRAGSAGAALRTGRRRGISLQMLGRVCCTQMRLRADGRPCGSAQKLQQLLIVPPLRSFVPTQATDAMRQQLEEVQWQLAEQKQVGAET